MIYKWEDFKLEINEKNSWKLFQFDFTGVTNTTETISTPAGMCVFETMARRGPGGWYGWLEVAICTYKCMSSSHENIVEYDSCLINAKHL